MHVLRRIAPFSVVTLALMLALALGALAMFGGNRADAADTETVMTGNVNCANLNLGAGVKELRVNLPADGTFTDGTLTVTIDVRNTGQGPVFDFTSNIGVTAVTVKGGPNTNVYKFDPPKTSATGLHAPVNPDNRKFFGLSHISFCYFEAGAVKITKTDDAGQPLADAEFTLYRDIAPTGGTRGAEDTITTFKCTTAADGTCTIANVTSGCYWLVETIVPPGHSGVADRAITVTSGQTLQWGRSRIRVIGVRSRSPRPESTLRTDLAIIRTRGLTS